MYDVQAERYSSLLSYGRIRSLSFDKASKRFDGNPPGGKHSTHNIWTVLMTLQIKAIFFEDLILRNRKHSRKH